MNTQVRIVGFGLLCLIVSFAQTAFAASIPEGFTESVLEQVAEGKIVADVRKDTENEFHAFHRAYYHKVSADSFLKLAINHPKYAALFDEVEDARTLESNSDLTELTYAMDLKVKVGFISFYLNGKGRHKVRYPENAEDEGQVLNELLNYKDKVTKLTQNIRLVPYKEGMLVEQELVLKMHPDASSKKAIKDYLKNFLMRYLSTFRTELEN
ncbi:MAG: hypothetical protein KDD51_05495 [Bdellovibrionales bacterium]|nr:hypothetical protein [Bdellovibrionales bacterium]